MHFPTQRESVNTIIKLANAWLEAHPRNVVMLRPPANYGYEFLLVQLSQHFKFKIHVGNATFQDYQYIPDFDTFISNNPYHCGRIHLCASGDARKWQLRKSVCSPSLDQRYVCIIRPTAMKWKHLSATDQHYDTDSDVTNIHSVCYSNHSSYDEIKYLIQYLQPKSIKLNVVPSNVCQRNEIYSALDTITKDYEPNKQQMDMEVSESICTEYNFSEITSHTNKRSMSIVQDEISQLKIKRRRQF